ncbi:helix-turn-helix domain-containing protein [Umezawaea tangerina]|uniref:Cro/C1-type helix-turn-helix DNA-binding protein n=1 Tax=Umezawaea tangerina TaxID=84725 RepID=A0A2T0SPI5_9PSEU|nr:helix-turn-helix transcriptional regulator [Umezawaea tangerina]PRY35273.1 Cro/C1-type helix-turn-helix DNA-binding protein [Umezawaea tangerina]
MHLIANDALTYWMTERKVSVRALARAVDRGPSTIDRLRTGKQKYCDPEVARRIETVLNVSTGSLFVVPAASSVQRRRTGQKVAA